MVPNLQATVGVEILLRICGTPSKPEKKKKQLSVSFSGNKMLSFGYFPRHGAGLGGGGVLEVYMTRGPRELHIAGVFVCQGRRV